MSHSTRVRGLKLSRTLSRLLCYHVALYTSAWIEIPEADVDFIEVLVALYTSAWIEIFKTWE